MSSGSILHGMKQAHGAWFKFAQQLLVYAFILVSWRIAGP